MMNTNYKVIDRDKYYRKGVENRDKVLYQLPVYSLQCDEFT